MAHAYTVKPTNTTGDLTLLDDDGGVVGHGFMQVSLSEPGMVTLRLYPLNGDFILVRVPTDWVAALTSLTS